MANSEHLKVVRAGTEAITEWRASHPKVILNLKGGDLENVRLQYANLTGSDLTGANLNFADLSETVLNAVKFAEASLVGATFESADLTGADFSKSSLLGADFVNAILLGTRFVRAILAQCSFVHTQIRHADFTGALLFMTIFANVDLSDVSGLATVHHRGPSTIGVDTLLLSLRRAGGIMSSDFRLFCTGAGVPQELLDEVPRMVADVKYHSCFISYGEPDRAFAERLRENLVARGISAWLFAVDAIPGKRTQGEIGQKRREAEKMIVLCSHKALVRDGVLKEIEEQIDEYPDKMVPISLDNDWKEQGFRVMRGDRDLKQYLADKNYADFASLSYNAALERLLQGLEWSQT